MCEPFATFDPVSSSWRTCEASSPTSEPYSGRWPSSGTMRNGRCFERPRSGHRTSARGSSSWPTPVTKDHQRGEVQTPPKKGQTRSLSHAVNWPTPLARDGKGAITYSREGGDDLVTAVRKAAAKWPTPVTTDAKGARRSTARNEHWQANEGTTLTDAIRMYPTPPRAATSPQDGKREAFAGAGKPSLDTIATWDGGTLNPSFVEALMGFPPGWTDLRSGQLDLMSRLG